MTSRFGKILVKVILILFCLTLTNAFAGELSRTIMKVSKLSCGACLIQINAELKKLAEFDSMGSNLRRGIVAVDHKPSLGADKIASVITGLGYPATIVRKTKIPEEKAFSKQRRTSSGGSCCSSGSSYTGSAKSKNYRNNSPSYSQQSCGSAAGCGGIGPGSSRSCGAGSAAWRQLFKKSSANTKTNEQTTGVNPPKQ